MDGRLEGGSIYTPGYVRRLRAQLRGAMRAALVPTTRDALVTNALRQEDRHDVADAALTGAVLGDLARGTAPGPGAGAAKKASATKRNENDTGSVPDATKRKREKVWNTISEPSPCGASRPEGTPLRQRFSGWSLGPPFWVFWSAR